jgi:hypothetical protein
LLYNSTLAGEDYEAIHETRSFPINSNNGARVCFNITVLDDNVLEGDQYFIAQLESSENNVVIHTPYIKITIGDNESESCDTIMYSCSRRGEESGCSL